MNQPRDVIVLGSTGSIGAQALDVIARNPDLFRVVGLAAGGAKIGLLAEQVARFAPDVVAMSRGDVADLEAAIRAAQATQAKGATRPPRTSSPMPKLIAGPDAAAQAASWPRDASDPRDIVVLNGVTGSVGLTSTLATLEAGRTLALANKESLIVGGPLVKAAAAPGQIVPVDSEHSALAQCLRGGRASEVRRLLITASGGPFRGRRRAELADVTPEQALAHPTWKMGPVITINSATLVNKGLEVIEANLLFDIPLDRVDVVVHPQSKIHSMVEFVDGSTIAQCSPPDMRLPIALGLQWPDRVPDAVPTFDWTDPQTWTFEALDDDAFPAIRLARQVGTAGGIAPAVYNAANEEAVDAFMARRLPFLSILDVVERVVDEICAGGLSPVTKLSDVLDADSSARARARELIAEIADTGAIGERAGAGARRTTNPGDRP